MVYIYVALQCVNSNSGKALTGINYHQKVYVTSV